MRLRESRSAPVVTAQELKTITWASAGLATTRWPAAASRCASVSISL
jgi:hypothetical protein